MIDLDGQLIPGTDTLGMGFDVDGTYDAESTTRALFEMEASEREWTQQSTGITYALPENASFDPSTSYNGYSEVYRTRTSFEESFAAKASVSARYKLFSGQFSASYKSSTEADSDYTYALYFADSKFWTLTMQDPGPNALASWVTEDPVYQQVPDTYSDEDRDLFFQFFDRYGAYYVTGLQVGGRLYYSCSVEKSYERTEEYIDTKFQAEYKAVFASVEAQAEAEWKQIGEEWTDERTVVVSALAGDTGILNVLVPDYGDSYTDAYAAWLESSQSTPAVIGLTLSPISGVFPQEKIAAVNEAIEVYEHSKIVAESKTGACAIGCAGRQLMPSGGGDRVMGFQMAAIGRSTGEALWRKSYPIDFVLALGGPLADINYEQALADVKPLRMTTIGSCS